MTVYVRDTFSRTVASAWGTPNIGPAWSMTGSLPDSIGVNGSRGTWASPTMNSAIFTSSTALHTNIRMEMTITIDKFPIGGDAVPRLTCRVMGANDYNIRFAFKPDGTIRLSVARTESGFVVSNIAPAMGLYSLNTQYRLIGEVMGTSPTSIRAKIWPVGSPEPGWDLQTTDSTAGYQVAGFSTLRLNQATAVSNKPIAYTVDNILIWDGTGSPTGFEVSVWNGVTEDTGYDVTVWDGTQEQPADFDSLR